MLFLSLPLKKHLETTWWHDYMMDDLNFHVPKIWSFFPSIHRSERWCQSLLRSLRCVYRPELRGVGRLTESPKNVSPLSWDSPRHEDLLKPKGKWGVFIISYQKLFLGDIVGCVDITAINRITGGSIIARHALLDNRKTQDIENSYHLNIDLELHGWAMVMVI